MSLIPYAYQEACVSSVFNYYVDRQQKGDVIAAMPTGTGKSLIPAIIITRALGWWPHMRFMLLTHVKELVRQNAEKLLEMWPSAPLGIYSAGLDSRHTVAPIIYGSMQSAVNCISEFGHRDILFIDEAHLLSASEATNYQKIILGLRLINPNLKVIGLSATPWRTKDGSLVENGLFDEVVFDITGVEAFNRLIAEGYLSPLVPRPTTTFIDTDGLHFERGDFNRSELETAADRVTYDALTETMDLARDRKCGLVFASGVQHAEHAGDILRRFGISNVVIHSKISGTERDARLRAFKNGDVQYAVGNNILTTGFDHPPIDLLVMLRATMSPGLWVQMLGRGTRPLFAEGTDRSTVQGRLEGIWSGGKRNCLVLDFARNTPRLGPINDPVIPETSRKKKSGPGDVPVRICPQCNTYMSTKSKTCDFCGHEFPFTINIFTKAGKEELIRDNTAIVEYRRVTGVTYTRHTKANSPDSLKITYFCGDERFNEWVSLESNNTFAKKMARDWWRQRWPDNQDPPASVYEALQFTQYLKCPQALRVQTNLKHPTIVGVEF